MKIEIEIKDEDIIDALSTALEGGSNYWYWIENLDYVPENIDRSYVEYLINWILQDAEAKIKITDVETSEDLGYLSNDNIKRGIDLFINNGYVFDPAMDAGDADILFQYIVMGEIIYG